MSGLTYYMIVICLLAIFVKADTDSAIDLHLKIDDPLLSNYMRKDKNLRELRGRGGGRSSRYSGSRSYSKSQATYKKNYAATNNYRYAYSTYKNPTTYSNSYYSVRSMRTTRPLYVYYRAPNYFNGRGYYSSYFLLVYYNGYGYNFYYGRYGYYEYSINQTNKEENPLAGVIVLAICCICSCGMIAYCIKTSKDEEEEEYGSEYGSEEEEVIIEKIVIEDHPGY